MPAGWQVPNPAQSTTAAWQRDVENNPVPPKPPPPPSPDIPPRSVYDDAPPNTENGGGGGGGGALGIIPNVIMADSGVLDYYDLNGVKTGPV